MFLDYKNAIELVVERLSLLPLHAFRFERVEIGIIAISWSLDSELSYVLLEELATVRRLASSRVEHQ